VKLLQATHLTTWHDKIVQAKMTTDDMSSGTELYMLEPEKCLSRESQMIVSNSLVQPNHEHHFKVSYIESLCVSCLSRSWDYCHLLPKYLVRSYLKYGMNNLSQ